MHDEPILSSPWCRHIWSLFTYLFTYSILYIDSIQLNLVFTKVEHHLPRKFCKIRWKWNFIKNFHWNFVEVHDILHVFNAAVISHGHFRRIQILWSKRFLITRDDWKFQVVTSRRFCFIIKDYNKRLKYRQKTCDGKCNVHRCIVAIQLVLDKS